MWHIFSEAKHQFLKQRGVEILRFADESFQVLSTVTTSRNQPFRGEASRWSCASEMVIRHLFTLAAIANVDSILISDKTQERLGTHLRAYILLGGFSTIKSSKVLNRMSLRTSGHHHWLRSSWRSPARDLKIPFSEQESLFFHTSLLATTTTAKKQYWHEIKKGCFPQLHRPLHASLPCSALLRKNARRSSLHYPRTCIFLTYSKGRLGNGSKACYDEVLRSSPAFESMEVWYVLGAIISWVSTASLRMRLLDGIYYAQMHYWDEPTMSTFKGIFTSFVVPS